VSYALCGDPEPWDQRDTGNRNWVIILDASPPRVFTMNVVIQLDLHNVPAELFAESLYEEKVCEENVLGRKNVYWV
jgi:hypothetical protein